MHGVPALSRGLTPGPGDGPGLGKQGIGVVSWLGLKVQRRLEDSFLEIVMKLSLVRDGGDLGHRWRGADFPGVGKCRVTFAFFLRVGIGHGVEWGAIGEIPMTPLCR